MIARKTLLHATVCMTAMGMLVPGTPLQAANLPITSQTTQIGSDVVLTGGTMVGQLITSAGVAVDGAVVTVTRNGEEIRRTTTDSKGMFSVDALSGGIYQVSAGGTVQTVRAWGETVAPPSATEYAVLTQDAGTVRSQDRGISGVVKLALWGGAIAVVTLGVIALTDDDDDEPGVASP